MRSALLLVVMLWAGVWLVGISPLPPLLTVLLLAPFAWALVDLVQP
jgi:hypothetical protein